MCVKINKDNKLNHYSIDEKIEAQIVGSEQIIVNYRKQHDVEVDHFINELERLAREGFAKSLDIKLINNNNLATKEVKDRLKKLEKQLHINLIAKEMTSYRKKSDRILNEMLSVTDGK